MMNQAILSNTKTFFCLFLFIYLPTYLSAQHTQLSGMDQLQWEKVLPGVWKANIGKLISWRIHEKGSVPKNFQSSLRGT